MARCFKILHETFTSDLLLLVSTIGPLDFLAYFLSVLIFFFGFFWNLLKLYVCVYRILILKYKFFLLQILCKISEKYTSGILLHIVSNNNLYLISSHLLSAFILKIIYRKSNNYLMMTIL